MMRQKNKRFTMPPLINCHPILFAATALIAGTISLMGWSKLIHKPNRKTDVSSEKLTLENDNSRH